MRTADGDEGPHSEDGEEAAAKEPPRKKALTIEDLQKHGYKDGPSVLLVRPPTDSAENNWAWDSGAQAKGIEREETAEDRLRNRMAANEGAEAAAHFSKKAGRAAVPWGLACGGAMYPNGLCPQAQEHAAKLREEAMAERERLREENRLTFNQKEKRKRNAGQATKAKNYVEEASQTCCRLQAERTADEPLLASAGEAGRASLWALLGL